ncbi:SAM-dependent methyltransferase [Thermodesulfobacteriota bacterium]
MKQARSKANRWEDHYARKAQRESFPARSVYKLKEIQRKYKIIKKGNKILDLGCAPGSWLLYAAEVTGADGLVIGVDQKPVSIQAPTHVRIYTADIFSIDPAFLDSIGKDFDVILSDMAPKTTGHKHVDATRSLALCRAALSLANRLLLAGGVFVCKIFAGEDAKAFSDAIKKDFYTHKVFKPQSSRKASKEIYVIGLGKK